jgi:hypothetical protein
MKTETQNTAIKQHLESGATITPLEALEKYGSFRLSGRIHDLRRKGLPIETKIIKAGNKHFAEYKLRTN